MGRDGAEFWTLTYREIFACVEEYLNEREERFMLFGTVAASPLNAAGYKDITWTSFFKPRNAPDQEETSGRVLTLEQTRARWREAFAVVGTNK